VCVDVCQCIVSLFFLVVSSVEAYLGNLFLKFFFSFFLQDAQFLEAVKPRVQPKIWSVVKPRDEKFCTILQCRTVVGCLVVLKSSRREKCLEKYLQTIDWGNYCHVQGGSTTARLSPNEKNFKQTYKKMKGGHRHHAHIQTHRHCIEKNNGLSISLNYIFAYRQRINLFGASLSSSLWHWGLKR
jgi:hypothetical protein